MLKAKLKQGTLAWENARACRIGSSEVFDIVRYYADDAELQNCGINAENFRAEKPFTTTFMLYHKLINDGIYQKEALAPEFSEYGHAVEPYGCAVLQRGRKSKLKAGEVFIADRLIASLDISGISEDIDLREFHHGGGMVPDCKRFVCEQKTAMPQVMKNGLPLKYIIQAQYQITMTSADFLILQIMELAHDTPFERGKITQMSRKKMFAYLDEHMTVTHLYIRNNEHLAALIKTCLDRFFHDVDNRIEPTPFIESDSQKNIIESIRLNSVGKPDIELDFELTDYVAAKSECDTADAKRKSALQRIVESAQKHSSTKFKSKDGTRGSFDKRGAFLLKKGA